MGGGSWWLSELVSAVSEGGGSIFEDGCCSPFWVSVVLAGILLHFGVGSSALLLVY